LFEEKEASNWPRFITTIYQGNQYDIRLSAAVAHSLIRLQQFRNIFQVYTGFQRKSSFVTGNIPLYVNTL